MVPYITVGHRRWARKVARTKVFEDVAYEYILQSTFLRDLQRWSCTGVDATTEGWMVDGLAKVNRVGGNV